MFQLLLGILCLTSYVDFNYIVFVEELACLTFLFGIKGNWTDMTLIFFLNRLHRLSSLMWHGPSERSRVIHANHSNVQHFVLLTTHSVTS